jgi:hypothetical protein
VNAVFVCAAIGLLLGGGGCALGWWGWGWAILFTLIMFVVSAMVLVRVIGRRLQPAMQRVHNQMQSGMLDAALQGLRELLPKSRWMPMLRGQLLAQMGAVAWHAGKRKESLEWLSAAPARLSDAKMLLASILWRDGEKARAFDVLQAASRADKRDRLLPNVHAWMLCKEDRFDDAAKVLTRYLGKHADDSATQDNFVRLQNRRRLAMEPFGMAWYGLQLEKPPAEYGEVRTARKGFRTPPKQPKQPKQSKPGKQRGG